MVTVQHQLIVSIGTIFGRFEIPSRIERGRHASKAPANQPHNTQDHTGRPRKLGEPRPSAEPGQESGRSPHKIVCLRPPGGPAFFINPADCCLGYFFGSSFSEAELMQ